MMEYRLHGVVQPVLLSVPGKVCVFDFAVADGLIPPPSSATDRERLDFVTH